MDTSSLLLVAVLAVLAGSLIGSALAALRSALAKRSASREFQRLLRKGDQVIGFRKPKRPRRRIRIPRPDNPNVVSFGLVASAFALVILFKFGGPLPFTGSTLEGRVTHVRDGDTIVVNSTPIRLAKLDCAELGTVQGAVAKRKMFELASGQEVVCRLHGRKSYDREIGECRLSDGRDLSRVMLSEGVCRRWW